MWQQKHTLEHALGWKEELYIILASGSTCFQLDALTVLTGTTSRQGPQSTATSILQERFEWSS